MKPRFYELLSRFYFAGDSLADASFRSQRDQRGFWTLSILLFDGRLQRSQLISFHRSTPCDLAAAAKNYLRCCSCFRLFLARFDVLIHPKEIARIVFILNRNQSLVVISVSCLDAILTFIAHQKVYVRSAR